MNTQLLFSGQASWTKPAGATLVVALSSSSCVGQLSADLLIQTLELVPCGAFASVHVLPCCGNDAVGLQPHGELALALQLFASADRRLFVMQMRAPVIAGAQRAFSAQLAAWAASAGFARVLLLAGLDARQAADSQVGAATLRVAGDVDAAAGVAKLEGNTWAGVPFAESRVPPWPQLAALNAAGVVSGALLLFCSDGDNSAASKTLATAAAASLYLQPVNWVAPAAWATTFGEQLDTDMF